MKRRDFIVSTAVRAGFRTSLKGFEQFCRAVELYLDDRAATIESIYKRIAVEFCCTPSSVEKNLRRLFDSSCASEALGKLFGISFIESGNKETVAMFANYVLLNRDKYAA